MLPIGLISVLIQFLLFNAASKAVVPLPPNGSHIYSPSDESNLMICAGSCGGNLAGYGCISCDK